jgi:hypothetical protein
MERGLSKPYVRRISSLLLLTSSLKALRPVRGISGLSVSIVVFG